MGNYMAEINKRFPNLFDDIEACCHMALKAASKAVWTRNIKKRRYLPIYPFPDNDCRIITDSGKDIVSRLMENKKASFLFVKTIPAISLIVFKGHNKVKNSLDSLIQKDFEIVDDLFGFYRAKVENRSFRGGDIKTDHGSFIPWFFGVMQWQKNGIELLPGDGTEQETEAVRKACMSFLKYFDPEGVDDIAVENFLNGKGGPGKVKMFLKGIECASQSSEMQMLLQKRKKCAACIYAKAVFNIKQKTLMFNVGFSNKSGNNVASLFLANLFANDLFEKIVGNREILSKKVFSSFFPTSSKTMPDKQAEETESGFFLPAMH